MTPSTTLTSADELSLERLAELFTRAYESYEVPMHVDAGAIAFMEETLDLYPERSRVAWRGGEPVGVAMLGVRGEAGWVKMVEIRPTASRRARSSTTRLRISSSRTIPTPSTRASPPAAAAAAAASIPTIS